MKKCEQIKNKDKTKSKGNIQEEISIKSKNLIKNENSILMSLFYKLS